MKQITLAFLLAIALPFGSLAQEVIQTVPTGQFAQAMDSLNNYQLVDVRTRAEFKQGHIEGAKQHDVNGKRFKRQVNRLDRNQPVLLYCRTGKRSHQAALTLQEMGFQKIINLDGGITDWVEDGYKVVRNDN